tara:strand:+ start:82 stop:591 length:510 start_codon:yes stop_codon:yes gene_type:complete
MKNILSILLVSIILIGCSEKRVLIDEISIKNKLFYTENGLYTGIVFDLFENGNLEFEYTSKNGESDGLYKVWYNNGQLKVKGIIEGEKITQSECFDNKGNPMECSNLNFITGMDYVELRDIYNEQIKENSIQLSKLNNDSTLHEKFAREKILRKNDGEDDFIIVKSSDE